MADEIIFVSPNDDDKKAAAEASAEEDEFSTAAIFKGLEAKAECELGIIAPGPVGKRGADPDSSRHATTASAAPSSPTSASSGRSRTATCCR